MINLLDHFNQFLYAAYAAIIGAVVLLIRKVLTNEKQIELLKSKLDERDVTRRERDDFINDQLYELRMDVKKLIGKMYSDVEENK